MYSGKYLERSIIEQYERKRKAEKKTIKQVAKELNVDYTTFMNAVGAFKRILPYLKEYIEADRHGLQQPE